MRESSVFSEVTPHVPHDQAASNSLLSFSEFPLTLNNMEEAVIQSQYCGNMIYPRDSSVHWQCWVYGGEEFHHECTAGTPSLKTSLFLGFDEDFIW